MWISNLHKNVYRIIIQNSQEPKPTQIYINKLMN